LFKFLIKGYKLNILFTPTYFIADSKNETIYLTTYTQYILGRSRGYAQEEEAFKKNKNTRSIFFIAVRVSGR